MQARLHPCTWLVPALLLQLTPLFSWTAADWYPHTDPAPAVCLQLRPPGRRRLLQPDGLAAVGEPITSGAAIINKHSPINTKDQVGSAGTHQRHAPSVWQGGAGPTPPVPYVHGACAGLP